MIEKINIHVEQDNTIVVTSLDTFKQSCKLISKYITPEEQRIIEEQDKHNAEYVKLFDEIIDMWLSELYNIMHTNLDIRGW